jgi:hypothetical protein
VGDEKSLRNDAITCGENEIQAAIRLQSLTADSGVFNSLASFNAICQLAQWARQVNRVGESFGIRASVDSLCASMICPRSELLRWKYIFLIRGSSAAPRGQICVALPAATRFQMSRSVSVAASL